MCDALPAPPASAVERSSNLIWYRYKIGPTHEPTPHKLNIHSLPTHSSCSLSLQTPRTNTTTEPKMSRIGTHTRALSYTTKHNDDVTWAIHNKRPHTPHRSYLEPTLVQQSIQSSAQYIYTYRLMHSNSGTVNHAGYTENIHLCIPKHT